MEETVTISLVTYNKMAQANKAIQAAMETGGVVKIESCGYINTKYVFLTQQEALSEIESQHRVSLNSALDTIHGLRAQLNAVKERKPWYKYLDGPTAAIIVLILFVLYALIRGIL